MCFTRLVLDSYIRQKACPLWNSVKSRYFTMANRIKQGGVISLIFLVYVMTMTMTMIIDLLNINVAMNCYECA